jgi:hypothetical protein
MGDLHGTFTAPTGGRSHVQYNMPHGKGGMKMYGVFGGYTRWAVVFLIIFVLFFLLIPAWPAAVS